MYSDSKKLQLIEEVLNVDNHQVLKELETILKKSKKDKATNTGSAHDFLGKWSKSDSRLIEKAIEDGCEQINPDEWK